MYAADTRRAQAASKGWHTTGKGKMDGGGCEVYPLPRTEWEGGYTFRNLRTTNLLDESTTHTRRWSSATMITLSARWTPENIFDRHGMGF